MDTIAALDAAGRPRSPATLPGYHAGSRPGEQGQQIPGRSTTGGGDRRRDAPSRGEAGRAAVSRVGSRALAGQFSDQRGLGAIGGRPRAPGGAMLIRHGKGGKRREVGMDDWGWQQFDPC